MKRTKFLALLLILPFIGHAEGQEGLVIMLDAIKFVIIFAIWIVIASSTIKSINNHRPQKLTGITKLIILLGPGLLLLFIWLMIRSDSHPFEGSIDSTTHKEQHELIKKNALDYVDSTIEETFSAIDTSEIGIYIWLNHKKVFVRKNTYIFYTQRQEDSLTMSIVRTWKK